MFWRKVYYKAIEECPKDTGALTSSIRLREKNNDATGPNVVELHGSTNLKGSKDVVKEFYITAGGAGAINPRHKKEALFEMSMFKRSLKDNLIFMARSHVL